jgi:hypothetical protein
MDPTDHKTIGSPLEMGPTSHEIILPPARSSGSDMSQEYSLLTWGISVSW